jgi:hypothetical protein
MIPNAIANAASPVRRQLIETAAHDLHQAATFHSRIRLGRAADWYIPQIAILRVLRGFVAVA